MFGALKMAVGARLGKLGVTAALVLAGVAACTARDAYRDHRTKTEIINKADEEAQADVKNAKAGARASERNSDRRVQNYPWTRD